MTEKLIAEVPCNDGDVIRITREITTNGGLKVSLREWFQDASQEWRPGRKGITIRQQQVAAVVGGILNASSDRRRI